ncbi:MAG: family N-acetyltransferase, partial [Bacilli bacterium]|nr:family N-acetyltransferase [Bacilli bacterium]
MITTIAVRTEDEPFLFQVYASTRYDEIDQWGWDQAAVQAFLSLQWNAQQRSYAMQHP